MAWLIGRITVAGLGRGGELELNTRDGALVQQIRSGALVVVRTPAGAAVLSGVAQQLQQAAAVIAGSGGANNGSAAASDAEVRLRSGLTGGAFNGLRPSGSIDVRTSNLGNRLNVEVEDVNLPPGTVLEVEVDGRVVGRITLDALRGGELELNSRDGATVGAIRPGATIVVRTPSRAAILSGVVQTRAIDTPAVPSSGVSSGSGSGSSGGSGGGGGHDDGPGHH